METGSPMTLSGQRVECEDRSKGRWSFCNAVSERGYSFESEKRVPESRSVRGVAYAIAPQRLRLATRVGGGAANAALRETSGRMAARASLSVEPASVVTGPTRKRKDQGLEVRAQERYPRARSRARPWPRPWLGVGLDPGPVSDRFPA